MWVIFYNSDELKESVPGCDSEVNRESVEVLPYLICLLSSSQSFVMFVMSLNAIKCDEVKSSFNYHQIIIIN